MLRAYLYLAAAGVMWLGEAFLFAYYLGMAPWQTALLGCMYASLFAIATHFLLRSMREHDSGQSDLAAWRAVSLAPMLVVIVGSFASLPLILLVLALGKLV